MEIYLVNTVSTSYKIEGKKGTYRSHYYGRIGAENWEKAREEMRKVIRRLDNVPKGVQLRSYKMSNLDGLDKEKRIKVMNGILVCDIKKNPAYCVEDMDEDELFRYKMMQTMTPKYNTGRSISSASREAYRNMMKYGGRRY